MAQVNAGNKTCIVHCSVLQYSIESVQYSVHNKQSIVVLYRTVWDQAALLDGVEGFQCVWVKIDLAIFSDIFHLVSMIIKVSFQYKILKV